MKNIGKPYTGKPYVRFDEGGLAKDSMDWLLRHRQTKGAETDRPIPTESGGCPLLYPISLPLEKERGQGAIDVLQGVWTAIANVLMLKILLYVSLSSQILL